MKAGLALRISVALVLLASVVGAFAMREQIDVAALEALVADSGPSGVALYMMLYVAATVLFLPGMVFGLAGGALFGPVLGTAVNLAAATVGATAAFLVARYLAADWVAAKAGKRLGRLISGVEAEGWRFVAFTRLVPLFPFNLLNYALGLTRIDVRGYVAATAICMAPATFAYTYLGYAGREALAGGEGTVQKALLALGLLAVVVFLPRLARRMRQRPRLDAEALKTRMADGSGFLVLDVRDAGDFLGEDGHIEGTLNIPLSDLEARLDEIEDWRERPLAVLCRTGKQSKKAVLMLAAKGFADVHLLDGGMAEWNRRGFPAVRGGEVS